jgi:hypothetical protein
MINAYDQKKSWSQSAGVRHYTSPYCFHLRKETQAFLLLIIFICLQTLIQLLFKGHFRYLMAHLPDSVQQWFK